MRRVLRMGGSQVAIEWEDDRLTPFVARFFAPWNCEDGEAEYRFTVSSDNDGYRLDMPGRTVLCVNEQIVALELEYSLTLLAQELLGDHIQVHGSCFGIDGEGVLIIGTHGIGKTTLALTAICSGMVALSDDICPVENDCRHMLGFPRPFKATADTWAMEPRPVPADCPVFKAADDITYVFFHEPQGKYYIDRIALRHVLFPVRREGLSVVEPIGETEAMQLLLTQGFNYNQRNNMTTARSLLSLLRNAPPRRMLYQSNWDAIDMIHNLLA
jgi:hypothetical protein